MTVDRHRPPSAGLTPGVTLGVVQRVGLDECASVPVASLPRPPSMPQRLVPAALERGLVVPSPRLFQNVA